MIVELMVKNGVTTKFSESLFKNLVNDEPIIELDFSEHDKVFEDKIAKLEENIGYYKDSFYRAEKNCNKLHHENNELKQEKLDKNKKIAELVWENESLKQRIDELERELEKKECIKTMRIEFHADNGEMLTPLEVANSVINQDTFKVDELNELAEYLKVYCRHHNDRDTETIPF